jgi:hypothetical protein
VLTTLVALVAAILAYVNLVFPVLPANRHLLASELQDTGAVLSITQELLRGRTLYEQIYTPYGPIPHSVYEVMAYLFGNTTVTYAAFVSLLSLVVITLTYILLRRYLSIPLTLVFWIIALYQFSRSDIVYANLEAIGVLSLALLWRPPAERTIARCVLYGVILAFIHFTKFASDLVAMAAFFSLDLLQLARTKDKVASLQSMARSGLVIILAFVSMVGIGALLLVHGLSPRVAQDVLWPLYLKGSYTYVPEQYRLPYFAGIDFFTRIELPMILGALACLGAMAGLLAFSGFPSERAVAGSRSRDVFPFPLLLPPLFFFFAMPVLFKHAWHYYQYGFYLALGSSLALCVFGRSIQRATLVALLVYPFIAADVWLKHMRVSGSAPPNLGLTSPTGDTLVGSPELVDFYQRLFSAIDRQTVFSDTTSSIAVFTNRPGIYYFTGREVAGRFSWYFPAYVRPWEAASEEAAFSRAGAFVLAIPRDDDRREMVGPEQISRSLAPLLPPEVVEFLSRRLVNPILIGRDPSAFDNPDIWVFAFSPEPGS